MDRYGGPQSALNIALYTGRYLAFIMDHYERPQSAHTLALHRFLYLAIIIGRCGGSRVPLQ
jgi:hypothetical protein